MGLHTVYGIVLLARRAMTSVLTSDTSHVTSQHVVIR